MLTLCVIGAGRHSQLFHLPALRDYRTRHPATRLAAICDLDPARAAAAAKEFGFAASYGSASEMLSEIQPDACLLIAPLAATSVLALDLLAAGCPVLVEKPLGPTIDAARAFVAAAQALETKAMVSMNRRFDPMTRGALDWIGDRPVQFIKAAMRRTTRTERHFLPETGIHLIDAIRAIGGEIREWESHPREIAGATWWTLQLTFAGGVRALVEIQPTCGRNEELIQLFGRGFSAEARSAEFDRGSWVGWERETQVASGDAGALAPFVANGTYAETEAFLEAVRRGVAPAPQPHEVLPGMEICHAAFAALPSRLS